MVRTSMVDFGRMVLWGRDLLRPVSHVGDALYRIRHHR